LGIDWQWIAVYLDVIDDFVTPVPPFELGANYSNLEAGALKCCSLQPDTTIKWDRKILYNDEYAPPTTDGTYLLACLSLKG
jgi:hypothetical protein